MAGSARTAAPGRCADRGAAGDGRREPARRGYRLGGAGGMTRQDEIAAFLKRYGYAGARAEKLAQDASFRRYLRLRGGPRPAVLMDAPPPEDIRPFLRIAAHLARVGVSVPAIFAADDAAG